MKPYCLADQTYQRIVFHSASPQGRSRKNLSLKNNSQLPLSPESKPIVLRQAMVKTPRFVRNPSSSKTPGCRLFHSSNHRETFLPLDSVNHIDNQAKIKHLLSVCSHLLPAVKPERPNSRMRTPSPSSRFSPAVHEPQVNQSFRIIPAISSLTRLILHDGRSDEEEEQASRGEVWKKENDVRCLEWVNILQESTSIIKQQSHPYYYNPTQNPYELPHCRRVATPKIKTKLSALANPDNDYYYRPLTQLYPALQNPLSHLPTPPLVSPHILCLLDWLWFF